MKFTSSGRTLVAAMMRSPSFSRSSSSRITTISPPRIAATMSSVESRPDQAELVFVRVAMSSQQLHSGARCLADRGLGRTETLEISGDDVDLDINSDAAPILADHGDGLSMRNHVDLEDIGLHGVHRETHAVDCDRALLRHIAGQRLWNPYPHGGRARRGREIDDLADAVDVARDEMAVERIAHLQPWLLGQPPGD